MLLSQLLGGCRPSAPPSTPETAQTTADQSPQPSPTSSQSETITTDELKARLDGVEFEPRDDGSGLFFSPGFGDRARELESRLDAMLAFYASETKAPIRVNVLVLDQEPWESLGQSPYGVNYMVPSDPYLIVFAATADHPLASTTIALSEDAPSAAAALEGLGRDIPSSTAIFCDLVGFHEVGHVLSFELGLVQEAQWLNELVATYLAYGYLRAQEPEQADVWSAVMSLYRESVEPEQQTLEAFDEKYVALPLPTFLWFHGQFQRHVERRFEDRVGSVVDDIRQFSSDPASFELTD